MAAFFIPDDPRFTLKEGEVIKKKPINLTFFAKDFFNIHVSFWLERLQIKEEDNTRGLPINFKFVISVDLVLTFYFIVHFCLGIVCVCVCVCTNY